MFPPFNKNSKPIVVSYRRDRLGARLWFYLHAWRLARKLGRNVVLYWWNPTSEFEKEYGSDYCLSNIINLEAFYRGNVMRDCYFIAGSPITRRIALDAHPKFLGMRSDRLRLEAFEDFDEDIYVRHKIVRLRGDTDETVNAELRELGKLFPPSRVIGRHLRNVCEWIGSKSYIAVHIRRGDVVDTVNKIISRVPADIEDQLSRGSQEAIEFQNYAIQWLKYFTLRVAGLGQYKEALMELCDPSLPILVFGDSPEIAKIFADIMDAGSVRLISDYQSDILPMQRAYLEMLLLSKSKCILTTDSAFSRVAAVLGDSQIVNVKNGRRDDLKLFDELFSYPPESNSGGYDYLRSLLIANFGNEK